MSKPTIGVDISKDHLDACRWPDGESLRLTNDAAGHRRLLRWIGGEVARVIFEATGAYHAAAVEFLVEELHISVCDLGEWWPHKIRVDCLVLEEPDAVALFQLARPRQRLFANPCVVARKAIARGHGAAKGIVDG